MYRCSVCDTEYKTKPDFCDCGNDEFLYIEEVVKPRIERSLSVEQKSQIISVVFFCICLLLSLVVWLIPIKSEVKEDVQNDVQKDIKPAVSTNIPNIDKIWDNTPPKVQEVNKQSENQVAAVSETSKPVVSVQPAKPKQSVTKPAQTKPVQSKPVQSKPTQTQNKSTDKKPAVQPSHNQKPVEQAKVDNKPKQTNNNIDKPKQNANSAKPDNKQDIKTEQPKKTYNSSSPEMLRYKGELRAALFRKLPVGSIQGSGTCSVHFAVDSTGKLINRGFTKQSDNKSLNDAVYYMMMSMPKYSPPPESYSGETINMTFTFQNGSYEVSIK